MKSYYSPPGLLDARQSHPRAGGPSYLLSDRFSRAVWTLVWRLFGAPSPLAMFGWRRLLLGAFGAKIAPTAKIYPNVRIWRPSRLEMAEHSCLGPGVEVYCVAPITLGRGALVSQGARLCSASHDVDDPAFQLRAQKIEIGAEAWVAAEAFVGPGVVIGEGAVLGARAVAFRDLAPWTVHIGNPAKYSRRRSQNSGNQP